MTLEYVPANNTRPFRAFERVEVLNRHGEVIGKTVVAAVMKRKRKVVTADGRNWSLEGEWFDGEQVWPFPTIRPAED